MIREYTFDHKNLMSLSGKNYLDYLKKLSNEELNILIIESALQIADIGDHQSHYSMRWGVKHWWLLHDEFDKDLKQSLQNQEDWKEKLIGNYRYAIHEQSEREKNDKI